MTNSFKSILSFVVLTLSSAYLTSCIPNVARTDARITPGWSVGGAAGYSATLDTPKKTSGGFESEGKTRMPAGEVDIQYGQRKEGGFGYALQLKVPLFFFATGVDAYLQLPSPKKLNYGVGAEFNALLPGFYGVVTVDLTPKYALSTTFRTLYTLFETDSDIKSWLLNPQLAVVSSYDDFKLSLFGSYMYSLNDGGIYEVKSFAFTTDAAEYSAKHFMYAGLAVSF